ncbi:hypothetical protein GCM10015535_68500 [Streptomyces gelaticus]|uniref:Uncharacterized protein n=2 Tax=Streptomyces gelaticus TaxID=285446 RepID=A0ABQ2W9Y8_9ACTN|nr:hypothetical protein GCM10015535_68500 [Streptomyces gelaticus]
MAAVGVLGFAGASAAQADAKTAQVTMVSTFHPFAPVYYQPNDNGMSAGFLGGENADPPVPAKLYPALCWAEGEFINDGNFAHDKWVLVDTYENDDGNNAWVWGGNLKGNDTGNVPNHC